VVAGTPQYLEQVEPVGERQARDVSVEQLRDRDQRYGILIDTRSVNGVDREFRVFEAAHRPLLIRRPQQRAADRGLLHGGVAWPGVQADRGFGVRGELGEILEQVVGARGSGEGHGSTFHPGDVDGQTVPVGHDIELRR
jgi:hypothetical protein